MTETQITVQEPTVPKEWGEKLSVQALAGRLQALMPGKLSGDEAMLLAQYSAVMDSNPFRGEIYAYRSRGKLILTEGYKLLVRWARRQCNFYERYERITNDTDTIPEGAIAFRCRILRQDSVRDLTALTQAQVPNAYEICSTEAVGVVTQEDTWSKKYNKPVTPPKGWTWEDVARKRALKNALNRAYGAPSPREIAAETWRVEDTLTIPEDWSCTTGMTTAEAEANAKYNATARQIASEPSTRSAQEDIDGLFGAEPQRIVTEKPGNRNPQGEPAESTATPTERPPEAETNETAEPETPNGLDHLLDDTNARLTANGLPQYTDKAAMLAVLKKLGHSSYNELNHATLLSQLIMEKEPNGKEGTA